MQVPLRVRSRDLPTIDMKDILQQRMFEDDSYKAHTIHNDLYKALQKTPPGSPPSQPPPPLRLAGASGAPSTSGVSGTSQLPPPPLPPSTGTSAQQQGNKAPSSSKTDDSIHKEQASVLAITYEPPTENSLLAKIGDMTTFFKCLLSRCHSPLVPDGGVSQDAYSSGHVTIQPQFSFNKDLEYLRYGSKGSNPALSISKMKAASYLDFGLELLKFYIDRHDSPSRRKDVKTHMRILSVIRIKAYSRYGDFEDMNLLLLQSHLDHLPGSDKQMLSTVVKQWTRNFVIRQRIMRFNEIYKFSDGTLTRILKALDYKVKEFKVKRLNPGMNTRFWTQKDVTRSKEFIEAIERRLKTRRIFQNLECFIGGCVRDIDYRLL
ncbi:hypothetical protein Tco_0500147 [Tanacetum coccineum]